MTILVTGANGFVGSALCRHLIADGRHVRAVVRSQIPAQSTSLSPDVAQISSIDAGTSWSSTLHGIDSVVHLAARVHVMDETVADPLHAFRRVNVDGTTNLARQAAAAGAKRFVFVSSVKVNGEETAPGAAFSADDVPNPQDPYGVSKLEAEQGLKSVADETGLEVVIVRPPLIYGAGVKANFARMMAWLARGRPLPLGAVQGNRRSLLALDNLVDLLSVCLEHPAAAGQIFMASDGEDLSTTDLLRRLARALGTNPRLISIPPALLRLGAQTVGKGDIAQRLLGNLQVDSAPTRERLGWTPPLSVDEGLRRAAEGYLKGQRVS